MSFQSRFLMGFMAVLGIAASACSAPLARPSALATESNGCQGATLQSAAEVAAYAHCTTVTGDLRIEGTDLTSLDDLAALRRVSGTLAVTGNAELESLRGLSRLASVGALEIIGNAELENLRGLEGLVSVENVRIEQNGIVHTSGLGNLRHVGTLVVKNNPKLVSLAGLKGVERAKSVDISKNRVLAAYFGILPELAQVDDDVVLRGNTGISKREARAVLERIEQSDAPLTLTAERSTSHALQ